MPSQQAQEVIAEFFRQHQLIPEEMFFPPGGRPHGTPSLQSPRKLEFELQQLAIQLQFQEQVSSSPPRAESSALVREMALLRQEISTLRNEFRQFVESVRELPPQKSEGTYTLSEQNLVINFSHQVLAVPEVEAVGYRRNDEGMLEICTLLSTRELDPERAVIRLGVEMEDRFPSVDVEFSTLLKPPGSRQELERHGYQILAQEHREHRD